VNTEVVDTLKISLIVTSDRIGCSHSAKDCSSSGKSGLAAKRRPRICRGFDNHGNWREKRGAENTCAARILGITKRS
jgi:hypothetical protein